MDNAAPSLMNRQPVFLVVHVFAQFGLDVVVGVLALLNRPRGIVDAEDVVLPDAADPDGFFKPLAVAAGEVQRYEPGDDALDETFILCRGRRRQRSEHCDQQRSHRYTSPVPLPRVPAPLCTRSGRG